MKSYSVPWDILSGIFLSLPLHQVLLWLLPTSIRNRLRYLHGLAEAEPFPVYFSFSDEMRNSAEAKGYETEGRASMALPKTMMIKV